MKKVKDIAFLFCLLGFLPLKSQEKMMNYHGEAIYHYGYLLAHRNNVEVLVQDYSKIMEFSFARKFNGEKEWQEKYSYPYAGFSMMFLDFGNPEQLGKGMSLFAYYNFPLFAGPKFEFCVKVGFGPGFVEEVFEKTNNYKNQVVSLHFNGFAHGNVHARYTFAKNYTATAGLSLSHFSNAAASKPNLGINVPSLNVGIGYRFKESDKIERDEHHAYSYDKKWIQEAVASFGRKANQIGGDKFGAFSMAYALSKHVSFKSRLGVGGDFFYNAAHRDELNSNGEYLSSNKDIIQLGLNFSYTLQVDDLGIFLNQGFYVYDKFKKDGSSYLRMGMRYLLLDHLVLNLSMKTHWAVADHVEIGVGFRL